MPSRKRSRISSWRGSLRAIKATPTTAATITTDVIPHAELSLPTFQPTKTVSPPLRVVARRRRKSSVSQSSTRSSSPSTHSFSPPTYSAPLLDPPPSFMDTAPDTNDTERDPQPIEQKRDETTTNTATWWNYVSWTSSTLTTTNNVNPQTDVNTPPTSPAQPLPPIPIQSPLSPTENTSNDLDTGMNEVETIDNPTTAESQPRWSAYVPTWSWGSSQPTVSPDPAAKGTDQTKEEILESASVSLPIDDERPPDSPAVNPLTTSFETDTLTWASFLRNTRKMLAVARITSADGEGVSSVKRDENGIEIMEVDFQEEGDVSTTTTMQTLPGPTRSRTPSRTPVEAQTPQAPSRVGTPSIPSKSKTRNMVLPKWEETFYTAPRSVVQKGVSVSDGDGDGIGKKILGRTVRFVGGLLGAAVAKVENERRLGEFGEELPKAWKVLEGEGTRDVLRGCKRVVVIGVHGWFPGAIVRTVLGEPTGTSAKFASMMGLALEAFENEHGVAFDKITLVPLQGQGTIEKRVDMLYSNLLSNPEWTRDLHNSDAIFFATHSQGCVVSTHLLDRLYRHRHVLPRQRVCLLGLCGIHLGPLRYLGSSTLVAPYLQYFETVAARELFEFQNTESQVSKDYVKALSNILDHGTKIVYIASLNDQVVPMYSGLFTAASHPLILRALYIDGDAYSSSDFLSNLVTLLIRVLNSGLSDSGLLAHLSEATAGSLNGVGHSTAYEEIENYSLAVKYLFLTNDGARDHEHNRPELKVEPFNALVEQNDYEIPWSLRDLIANPLTSHFFSSEIEALRNAFKAWHPKTAVLRDLRRKVAPLGRPLAGQSRSQSEGSGSGVVSKL